MNEEELAEFDRQIAEAHERYEAGLRELAAEEADDWRYAD